MKSIKSILLFLAIFFIGQWVIVLTLDFALSKSSFRYSKLYYQKEQMNNSILCIGNSRGVNSFYAPYINKDFSETSFNLSYNGLTMPMANMFIDAYLKKHKAPKLVYIEVSSVFNKDGVTGYSGFKIYSGQSEKLKKGIAETDEKTHLLSTVFPLFKYNTELLYRSLFYLTKSSDQDWINRYTISHKLEEEVSKISAIALPINNHDVALLHKMIEKLHKKGIKTQLYIAPYLPKYLDKISNLEQLTKKIEEKTGEKVINISGLLDKSEYFSDRIHTNEKGAQFIADVLMTLPSNE